MVKLKLKIITPERVLLESEVDSLSVPTQMGEITILPHLIQPLLRRFRGQTRERNSSARGRSRRG